MAWPSWFSKATNFLGSATGLALADSSVAAAVVVVAVALDTAVGAFANLAAFVLLLLLCCCGFRFAMSTAWNHTTFAGGQSRGYERRGLPYVWLVV